MEATGTDFSSDLEQLKVTWEYLSKKRSSALKSRGKLENTFLYKFEEGKKFQFGPEMRLLTNRSENKSEGRSCGRRVSLEK